MCAYTCVSCGKLVFESSEEQKEHFRSDFHRFNLKRKSVGLPPVAEDAFNAKMAAQAQSQAQAPAAKGKGRRDRRAEPSARKAPSATAAAAAKTSGTAGAVPAAGTTTGAKNSAEEEAAAIAAAVTVPEDLPEATPKDKEEEEDGKKQKEEEEDVDEEEEEEEEEETGKKKKGKKPYRYGCAVCGKKFRTYGAFNEHYASRKHRGRAMAAGVSPDPPEEMAAAARAAEEAHAARFPLQHPENFTEAELLAAIESRPRMAPNECLFCGLVSASLAASLDHMAAEHSFFVPDLDYCVDLPGLIAYLGEKIAVWTRCLWCPDTARSYYTTEAARQHMREKGHCKLAFELEDMPEYADFYDWSACAFPRGDGAPRPAPFEVADNGFEIMLPDGRIVGHRQMQRMYAQRYAAPELRDSVLANMRAQAARLRIAAAATGGRATSLAIVPSAGIQPYVPQDPALSRAQYREKTREALIREGKYRLKLDRNQKKIVKIEFFC